MYNQGIKLISFTPGLASRYAPSPERKQNRLFPGWISVVLDMVLLYWKYFTAMSGVHLLLFPIVIIMSFTRPNEEYFP